MKYYLLLLGITCSLYANTESSVEVVFRVPVRAQVPLDNRRTISVLRQLEGVRNPRQQGPRGELGYLRITPSVWYRYMTVPHRVCGSREDLERECAERHIKWLEEQLQANGIRPSIYAIAYCWNGGLNGFLRGQHSAAARDYARRADNIFRAS